MLADVAQPMHTDGWLDAEDSVHGPYEEAVDSRSGRSDTDYRFSYDGEDKASPYARTVKVARHAHRYYKTLILTFKAHGYNAKVDRITRRELNRAANALADLIAALP